MIEIILSSIFTILIFLHTSWMVILLYPGGKKNHGIESNRALPGVTTLIPAHDEERFIEATIRKVLSVDYPYEKKEIVVINDHSKDGTEEIVRELASRDPRIKIFATEAHGGKANAINMGLKKATNDIVVILDADSELKEDALEKIVKPFSDPEVAAVSGVIRARESRNPLTWFQDFEYILSSSWRYICNKIDGTYIFPGFAAFRKSVLLEIGGFSQDTFSEDFDIGLRLRRAGYKLEMSTAMIFTHVPESIGGFVKQRIRWGRGTIQVMRKHYGIILNRKYGAVGLYGLPTQIYWYMHGFIYVPIVLYQVASGYNFAHYQNYVSLDVLRYLFSWFSAYGMFDYAYKTLAGLYEMKPSFYFLVIMFFLYISYDIMMLIKFSRVNLKSLVAIFFFFPYSMVSLSLQVTSSLYELRFMGENKHNIWEKSF